MAKILFFDGVCVMCNGLIDFAMKHDQKRQFKFASLQGATAHERIPQFCGPDLKTLVLLDEKGIHTESDAIIRLWMGLGGLFRVAAILYIVPRFIRNFIYRLIARNRYRLFGKHGSCRLPTKEERSRMLD